MSGDRFHQLYLAGVSAYPQKTKKLVQQETSILWAAIKKKDKDFITVKIPRSSLYIEETDDSSDFEDSSIYIPKEAILLRKSKLKKASLA